MALVAAVATADALPWHLQRRIGVHINRLASSRVEPGDWPPEPPSPVFVDPIRFRDAIEKLCGWMPPGRAADYTASILRDADRFRDDPFLLGALVERMGRCNPREQALGGVGLTLIPPRMYWAQLRHGVYRYFLRQDGAWVAQTMDVGRYPFNGASLERPAVNLYFAAAFMAAWRAQHPVLDEVFSQAPHRSYISHFIWGDRVRSDRAEDRVLLDRRRLLFYYGAIAAHPPVHRLGFDLGSPLDGAPRVIESFLGDPRDGGARLHRGVDIEAVLREPVRAVADGVVNFAGVDLPGHRNHEDLDPGDIRDVPLHQLGRGGRYVCVLHEHPGGQWLRSCYMHLEDVLVDRGQHVHRGDRIGTVGRTGMKVSSSHLHFELHGPDGLLDPAQVLRGLLLGRKQDN